MKTPRGLGFPLLKDLYLKKGTVLYFMINERRAYFLANGKRITEFKEGNSDKREPNKIWFKKSKNS